MTDKGCNGDTTGGALTGMGKRGTLGGETIVLSWDLVNTALAVHFLTVSELARFSADWLVLAPFCNFD